MAAQESVNFRITFAANSRNDHVTSCSRDHVYPIFAARCFQFSVKLRSFASINFRIILHYSHLCTNFFKRT